MGPEWPSLTGRGNRVRLFPVHARGIAPEPFEIVEGSLLGAEHVDHDVDVVEEPPAGVTLTLPPRGRTSSCSFRARSTSSTTDLTWRRGSGSADHEVVRDHDQRAHVEDDDVLGLLRRGCSGGGGGRFAARRDPPAAPLLVPARHPVKSSPTMIVMSPIPDGTCETRTRPTPSASWTPPGIGDGAVAVRDHAGSRVPEQVGVLRENHPVPERHQDRRDVLPQARYTDPVLDDHGYGALHAEQPCHLPVELPAASGR